MTARRIARVVLDSPLPQLDRLFDYEIPLELRESIVAGVRVKAPLRSAGRIIDAFVVEVDDEHDATRSLASLDALLSPVPVMPRHLYDFARRVADRSCGSVNDVLRLVIPKRQARVEKTWEAPEAPELSPGLLDEAQEQLAGYPGLVDALAAGERIAADAVPRVSSLGGSTVGAWARTLAAAAAVTLARGRSSLVVVPDYRDLGALESALGLLLPEGTFVRWDAQQTGPARYKGFLRALDGSPCVIIGNRSTVYAPVPDETLGLIAIWDDGDTLLEEPLAPYAHARDVALMRQEESGAALLFLGHTRSSDVQRLVEISWVRVVEQAKRITPRVVLDAPRADHAQRVTSASFRAAGEAVREGPVLIQVARPGYAPTLVCADCRQAARCRACAGPLHATSRGAAPSCAWCGRTAHRWSCPHCSSVRVRLASSGSERTADELGRAFPGVPVVVSDGSRAITTVASKPALVIATRGAEPVAEGGYRAVILLDGERMLMADDLRIAEACLRWWSNAAALAAEGAPVHLVGEFGRLGRAFASWTQPTFAREELGERAPLLMPPVVRVARVSGPRAAVDEAVQSVLQSVDRLSDDAVLGPVPVEGSEDGEVTALIRFPHALGLPVAQALRARVVAQAVGRRGRGARRTNTLRVRMDVLDPVL